MEWDGIGTKILICGTGRDRGEIFLGMGCDADENFHAQDGTGAGSDFE